MIETGVNTDASRDIVKTDSSKQALICRVRGKRKRRRNRYSLINSSNCRYDLVRFTATKFSIKESLENWNIYWTDLSISVQRCKEMKRFQRINHFPGMMEICRKDLLARNLNRLYKAFPEEYNVFPKTWCLPTDMTEVTEYAKTHKGKCFIVKPDQGCQGRGIAITKNINQLKTYEKMICQQYIQRPFLIDGYKFDLRIYVLITSCDPMRLFVYNEGLARFATAKYKEPNVLNASNVFMHLTNYSVNKHSRTYIVDDIDGSKRKLSTINLWFQKNNYDVKQIWDSIDDVIIKTMIVSLPTLKHYYHTCFPNHSTSHACFEILGFDFMFDYKLKPYVLEVNHSPSFNTETTIDHEVKESLLYDTFNILNLQHNNRFRVLIEDKKRARDRLFSVTQSPEILSREKAQEDRISQHRIEWENEHLGNYRKIYPGKNEDYYEKFIGARQNTMYAETVSSKAKEAVPKVGEQASPSRSKTKKLKVIPQEIPVPVKTKEGGDGISKEGPKGVEAIKEVVYQSDGAKNAAQTNAATPQSPAKTTKSKTAISEDAETKSYGSASNKHTTLPAEPEQINEVDERERISNMKKREFLVKSHGILEKVYENLKNAGLLKLETEIRIGRSNKWEPVVEGGKAYIEGYNKLNKSMVQVMDCLSKKVELRLPDRNKLGDELSDAGLGFGGMRGLADLQTDHLVADVEQWKVPEKHKDDVWLAPEKCMYWEAPEEVRSAEKMNCRLGIDRLNLKRGVTKSHLMIPEKRIEEPKAGRHQDDSRKCVSVETQDSVLGKVGTRLPSKNTSENSLPDSRFGFEKVHKPDHAKKILFPGGKGCEISKAGEKQEDLNGKTLVSAAECVPRKKETRLPDKIDSDELLIDFGLGLDRPSSRAGAIKPKTSTANGKRFEMLNGPHSLPKRPPVDADVRDCTSSKTETRLPEKVKPEDVLPDSLLKIDRPYAASAVGVQKSSFLSRGRKYDVSDDYCRKPPVTVEVVTPYVRQTSDRLSERNKPVTAQGKMGCGVTPALKIGHFGKPEAWESLKEYFEQRKILNRSWQNTDV